jgi:hypothetical protein
MLDIVGVSTLKEALALSTLLALGTIGLRDFTELMYSMPHDCFSKRAQYKFAVSTGYYTTMFALVTLVMYYVGTCFGV